jgi:hypothetical protein
MTMVEQWFIAHRQTDAVSRSSVRCQYINNAVLLLVALSTSHEIIKNLKN